MVDKGFEKDAFKAYADLLEYRMQVKEKVRWANLGYQRAIMVFTGYPASMRAKVMMKW